MKKTIAVLCLFFLAQIAAGQNNSKLTSYADEVFYNTENQLNFLKFKKSEQISLEQIDAFINSTIFVGGKNKVVVQKAENDQWGFSHIRFGVVQNGNVLANKIIVAHAKNGKVISINGDLYDVKEATNGFAISEKAALKSALGKINAKKYKWENTAEEAHMRESFGPDFTYYPHGTKVVFEKDGKTYNAYQFNIYAEEPLYRANVFVNASTGKILDEQNLICHADVPGTAFTKYSGTQSLTCDQNGSLYRLREVQRGLGIETYNMKNTSTYSPTDFTSTATTWTTTGVDQAATDAHWGAEKTYDYYMVQHNRNSINNLGYKLLSYVHYQTNYANAFWDGQRMTYGDGNGSSTSIFTALDVCGHEITHGLTSNTGNLIYANESGALNESYSDIFGIAIENFARPSNWNWKMGEDLTFSGNGLRNLSNPGAYTDPDTYGGTFYYTGTADNGGVHTNSGVSNYWFYLLTMGGSGTNDLSNPYSVTGIGMTNAAKIAFRALTVYFTPSTNFANARILTIQAAKDLFGDCSNEVIQTTRAWYAVGVGAQYTPGFIGPNFTANSTIFCSAPANVNFNNTTASGLSYTWYFGDGATATTTNAAHTYTAPGNYSVKLKVAGCASAFDSITKVSHIIVNAPLAAPVGVGAVACSNGSATLNATASSTVKWYTSQFGSTLAGTGTSLVLPNINSNVTYYAENTQTLAPFSGGLTTNSGGGFLGNAQQWLIFDVLQNSTLNTVVVYAQANSTRTVELRNSSNVILNSTIHTLVAGPNTLTLNYYLTPGTAYQLGLAGTTANLYRTNTNVNYPYNIGGCVEITSSSAGAGAYYWFYNWKIQKEECVSARTAVTASVVPLPNVSITLPSTIICISDDQSQLTGSPVGGTFSGSGVSGSAFNPLITGTGSYTLTYDYTDANGCSGSQSKTIQVDECTGLSKLITGVNSIFAYPNPAKEYLFIENNGAVLKVVITDALGRQILSKNIQSRNDIIQLNGLANGIYILTINSESGITMKTTKFIKE